MDITISMKDLNANKNKKARPIRDESEELGELEAYIQELSTFLPLPFCIVNPTGMILNINHAFSDLTGYDELEIVGEEVNRLFKHQNEAESLKEKVMKQGLIKGQEMTLITKAKKELLVSVSARIRKDTEDNMIGYFLAFADVTELKKLQKDLEAKIEERTGQLREKIEELEKFNSLAIGRELKMVELKEELDNLKRKLAG